MAEDRLRQLEILFAEGREQLRHLLREQERTRGRLHKIEASVEGLRHVPDIVRRELERDREERDEERQRRSALRVQWLALGVALGALVSSLLISLLH